MGRASRSFRHGLYVTGTAKAKSLAVLASRVRVEEKLLLSALDRRRITYELVDTRAFTLDLDEPIPGYHGALVREISHYRAYYAACLLEHVGVPAVNDSRAIATCGDKLLTTLALRAAGVPTPGTLIALKPEPALDALSAFGYPAVVKPLIGSWGRLAARLADRETAQAVLEHRAALPGSHSKITYIQRYIDKPDRDIRGLVAGEEVLGAIYRNSEHWRTSTADAASTVSSCPVTAELAELLIKAGAALGPGCYGIDVLENRDGTLYVNEVNHTPEFHGAVSVLGEGLVDRYLDYVLSRLAEADR
jgi:[lysine-biosynthesis-protein LysW]---L-2-aminoadipate ligase